MNLKTQKLPKTDAAEDNVNNDGQNEDVLTEAENENGGETAIESESADTDESDNDEAAFLPQVILDTDEFIIELTGNEADTETDFRAELLFTNKTENSLVFSGDVAAVNGMGIDGGIYESVSGNSSEIGYFSALYYEMEHFGVSDPYSITFDFTVVDTSELYGLLYYDTVTVYLYGDEADASGDTAPDTVDYETLYEDDNIYVGFSSSYIAELGVPAEERFVVPFLVINKTENNVRVTASSICLNETKTYPIDQVAHLSGNSYTFLLLEWNDKMLEDDIGINLDDALSLVKTLSVKLTAECCEQNGFSDSADGEYLDEEFAVYLR